MDESKISFFKDLDDLRLDARMVVIKTIGERDLAKHRMTKEGQFVQFGFDQVMSNPGRKIPGLEVPEVYFKI